MFVLPPHLLFGDITDLLSNNPNNLRASSRSQNKNIVIEFSAVWSSDDAVTLTFLDGDENIPHDSLRLPPRYIGIHQEAFGVAASPVS